VGDAGAAALRPAIVLLFAAVVIPVLLWLHPVGDYFVETDFYGGYAPGVRALFAHGLDPARYGVVGPVYELVLGLLSLLPVELYRLAQFLSLGSTVLALLLFSGWMERRCGRGAGWISALLAATNPTVFRYAYTASTDAPFACLLVASFVTLFPAAPRLRALVLAGLLAGLATLTRYTGIALVPLGVIATLWPGAANPWAGRRLAACGAWLGGVLLVLAPWWAFTAARGAPPALRFYHNLAYEVYARARGVTWDDYQKNLESQFPTFGSVIARDPQAVAARLLANTWEHAAQAARDLWLPVLAVLAFLGLLLWMARRVRGAGPLVAYSALLYLSLVPAFYAARYHLPLVLPAAGLAALALTSVRAPRFASALALGGALLAATYAGRATAVDTRDVASQVPSEMPDLAAALRRDWQGPGRPRLIARKPQLSYYADAEPVAFAAVDSLEQLARYAREARADYLMISWPEALLRPKFAFLLVPEFTPRGLERVAAGAQGHSVLYRVTPEFGSEMPAWYPREWAWRAGEGMTKIAPADAQAWLGAGEGRHARRDFAGALAAYERALALRPRWGRVLMDLGNLAADTGDFAAASGHYRAAEAAGERSPALDRNLGFVALKLGDTATARERLSRYVAATGDPAVRTLLAQLGGER
jgi:tetratricopeptide (TPR) repeat protein